MIRVTLVILGVAILLGCANLNRLATVEYPPYMEEDSTMDSTADTLGENNDTPY